MVGLQLGADDYVAAAGSRRLIARIRAVLRRNGRRGSNEPAERPSGTPSTAGLRCRPSGNCWAIHVATPWSTGEFDLLLVMVERSAR